MTTDQITFLTLSNSATASTITSNTATFTGVTIATAPAGFTVNEDSFQVYINGQFIPSSQRTTVQSGADIVVTFDTTAIGYEMLEVFEILIVGKLS